MCLHFIASIVCQVEQSVSLEKGRRTNCILCCAIYTTKGNLSGLSPQLVRKGVKGMKGGGDDVGEVTCSG